MIDDVRILKEIGKYPQGISVDDLVIALKRDKQLLTNDLRQLLQYGDIVSRRANGVDYAIITAAGNRRVKDKATERRRFLIPLVISIVSLVISVLSYIRSSPQ